MIHFWVYNEFFFVVGGSYFQLYLRNPLNENTKLTEVPIYKLLTKKALQI